MQVQTIYNRYLRHKKDLSDVSNALFLDWCDQINKYVYRKLVGIDSNRFITSSTYNISTGTTAYVLPTDFKSTKEYGCGMFEVDDNGQTDRALTPTGFGSSTFGYYINRGNINITPTNFSATKTYTLRYIPLQTTISGMGDYFTLDTTETGQEIIPDEYQDYVIKALDVLYAQWDEDPGSESLSDFRFTRVMDEMLADIKQGPNFYNLPDRIV
jgi:hypothetical protein